MNNFPDVAFGEFWNHLLAEDPVGHGSALHNLCLKHLVNKDNQHLLMSPPQVNQVSQNTDLRLLCLSQELEYRMKLGNGCERV